MTDIVERLRAFVAGEMILAEEAIAEAADEIERLRDENKRLSALVSIWMNRWEAEKADHEHSIAWADKEMKRDRPD